MKYEVKEIEGFEGTRIFRVEFSAGRHFDFANVWASDNRVACTACQTPLCGMSGSCAHAKAVKRYLAKSPAARAA